MIGKRNADYNVNKKILGRKSFLPRLTVRWSDTQLNLLNQQKGDFIMSKKNINVTYWTQSTGVTGQCLSERGQKLFDTTSALYYQATGEKLSKMKLYDIVLTECRETKKSDGFYIRNISTAGFMVAMQDLASVCRAYLKDREYKSISFGQFKVGKLHKLARGKVGRKKSWKVA